MRAQWPHIQINAQLEKIAMLRAALEGAKSALEHSLKWCAKNSLLWKDETAAVTKIDAALASTPGEGWVPDDVRRLVIAARTVAFAVQHAGVDPEAVKELDAASEAFASRVPWEEEPLNEE